MLAPYHFGEVKDGRVDTTRILLITDFALFRDGLRMILDSQQDMVLADEANDLDAAVRLAREQRPDVILLDLHLPRNTGVESAEQILSENPEARIIALIGSPDRDTVSKVLEAGVRGYLMKDTHAPELIQAIRCVASGGAVIDPQDSGPNAGRLPAARPADRRHGSPVFGAGTGVAALPGSGAGQP